jgi:hypothetical protein
VSDDSTFDAILRKVGHAPPRALGASFIDPRYELGELLGEGSFGAVYDAFDRVRHERVALKILHRASGEAILRFKREFRLMAALTDPGFVRLYDLHGAGDHWYFTMERIEGAPFDAWIRDPERLRPALEALGHALERLHRAGYVHRDVKPSNVLVEQSGRVVLLDFGLVHAPAERSTAMAGTPLYVAPEVAAGEPPTPASDRYAVGVMLYEALTGALPFDGATPEILAKKQRARPVPVLELAPGAPRDLALLADALLDRTPSARPAIDGGTMPASAARAPFVGRATELAVLEQLRASGERIVRVFGASGVGKSTLVEEFTSKTRARGVHVLRSRCHPRDHVPFVAIDGLIDDLAQMLKRLPPAVARALAPLDANALVRTFPVLRVLVEGDQHEPGEGARSRIGSALWDLLAHWIDRAPWLLVIDDAQWADADSAAVLETLLRAGALPLTIVLVHRDHMTGPLVDRIGRDARAIEISALAPEDARALARESGAASSAEVDGVVGESGGHPLFLVELVRERARGGSARTLRDIVLARIGQLSSAALHALRLLTIAGSPLPVVLLAQPSVDELRELKLISFHDLESVRVAHDRVLDIVATTIGEEAKRALHRELAAMLVAAFPDRHEALAYHLHEGGDREAAAEYLLRAARDATRARAFAQARALYMRLLSSNERDKALRIESAEVSALVGLAVESADGLLAASRLTSGDEAVVLRVRAAEQLLLAGHRERGERILDDQLHRLGLSIPSTTPGLMLGVVRDKVGRHVDRVRPKRTTELRLRALWSATRLALLTDPVRSLALGTCLLREVARPGATEHDRLAGAFVEATGLVFRSGPMGLTRGRALLDAALRDRTDPRLLQLHAFAEGLVAHMSLENVQGMASFERAEKLGVEHRLGHGYEETVSRMLAGSCAFALGDIPYLRTHIGPRVAELDERDQLLGWVLVALHRSYLVFLEEGEAPARLLVEEVRTRWRSRGLELQEWWFDLYRIHVALADGDGRSAMNLASPSSRGYRERVLATFYHRVEARVLQLRGSILAREDIKAARRGADELARIPAAWARAQAECLRAGIASVSGDRAGAVASLERAIGPLDDAKMPLLRVLVDDALGSMVGGDEGRELSLAARARLREWRVDRDRAMACNLPGAW